MPHLKDSVLFNKRPEFLTYFEYLQEIYLCVLFGLDKPTIKSSLTRNFERCRTLLSKALLCSDAIVEQNKLFGSYGSEYFAFSRLFGIFRDVTKAFRPVNGGFA